MATNDVRGPFQWTLVVPIASVLLLAATWANHDHWLVLVLIAGALVSSVIAAVFHAEIVAHKVGEPFGSLILAVAVTVIEVGLIVMLMTGGGSGASTYARDTVFAALMITLNGIVGISLLVGALKHHLVSFNPSGTGSALSTVITLASLTMVLPAFTTSGRGLEFSASQLTFAATASLVLYAGFVFTQTVRHRDFFIPVRSDEYGRITGLFRDGDDDDDDHAAPPTSSAAWRSVGLLLASLVAVVGLAKMLSPTIEDAVQALGFPYAVVGVVIALLVLAPESISAVRNAARDRVQISLNLGYGSAMASIGLTVPTIAIASIWLEGPLVLGLEPVQMVLLAITVVVSVLTVAQGRAKAQQGVVHLALLAAFLFLSVQP